MNPALITGACRFRLTTLGEREKGRATVRPANNEPEGPEMAKWFVNICIGSLVLGMTFCLLGDAFAQAACSVTDPTGTPLNVRTSPNGNVVGTLNNGAQVIILDRASRTGKSWVYVGRYEDHVPIGWVYRDYINCNTQARTATAHSMCFERHYDAAHLGKHPDQLITSMTLALDPDGPVARGSPTIEEGRVKVPFDFKIAMTRRGDNNLYVQAGYVENRDGTYRGVVECDGGGFTLRQIPSGVLLSIGLGAGYRQSIRMTVVPDPCGESAQFNNSVDIERGKDDNTFRLDAVSNQVCARLFDKIDWNAVGSQNQ